MFSIARCSLVVAGGLVFATVFSWLVALFTVFLGF